MSSPDRGHLGKDLMSIAPAPTVAREMPVLAINLLCTALMALGLVVWLGRVDLTVVLTVVIMGGGSLLRLAGSAVRQRRASTAH